MGWETAIKLAPTLMQAATVGTSLYLANKTSKAAEAPTIDLSSLAPISIPTIDDQDVNDEILSEETRLAQEKSDKEAEAQEAQIKADTLARKKAYFLSPTIKTAAYGLTGKAPVEKKKLKSLLGE